MIKNCGEIFHAVFDRFDTVIDISLYPLPIPLLYSVGAIPSTRLNTW